MSTQMVGVCAFLLFLLVLSVFSCVCALNWLGRQLGRSASGRRPLILGACGAGLLVLGCRLGIAEGRVSWAPYLDQWYSEIAGLLLPLVHGDLTWRDFTAGNNEHRIILTRAVSLAAVAVNGGWDNRVMVVGIFLLQSVTAAWVCLVAWIFLGWARGSWVAVAALLPMFLVCDWENIVSGFQDQICFMVLGSVVAFSLAEGWGAWVVALLMLGTTASGFLTASAMAGTGVVMAFVGRRGWHSNAGACAACVAIAALGWLTRPHFPPIPGLYSQGLGAWLTAFLAYAAWPLPPNVFGLMSLWLPSCVLVEEALRRREAPALIPFILGLGLWALLQAGALAWSRAGLSGLVSARYTEVLGWGFVANAAAFVHLLSTAKATRRMRLGLWAAMAVWFACVGIHEAWRSHTIYRPYFEDFRRQTLDQERRLGVFMRTGDASVIDSVGFLHIPGAADKITTSLRDPQVLALLPGPLRRDLVRDRNPSLLPSIHDGPLSLAAVHALRNGPWLAAAGIAMLLAAFHCARKTAAGAAIPGERLAAH